MGSTGLITLAVFGLYPDGKRVLWGSSSTSVFKADPYGTLRDKNITYIDKIQKEDLSLSSAFSSSEILSGAYTLVDRENVFYVPRFTKLYAFRDAVKGDATSEIQVKGVFEIPDTVLRSSEEKIVGLNMTYDGMIVCVTSHGLVCVVSRSFDTAFYISLGDDEEVSNSIACDEEGGIYVLTSKSMYRVQWTGATLTTDEAAGGWRASYETGGEISGVRLGKGSGATPTLMGTGAQDKFVCITDGQDLMHLVLFWRDKIPSGWEPVQGANERRIAAQVPVTFGQSDAVTSLSEQSVCIRSYGALVVNNQLGTSFSLDIINILLSGADFNAPYGAEKFEWDPVDKKLKTAWINATISIPNGIPSMSSATQLVYGVGQSPFGGWTFEALDWNTGDSVFSYRYGFTPAHNSAYAATEIGLDCCLYTGTLLGMAVMTPGQN